MSDPHDQRIQWSSSSNQPSTSQDLQREQRQYQEKRLISNDSVQNSNPFNVSSLLQSTLSSQQIEQSRTMSDSQKPQDPLDQSLNSYLPRSQNVNFNFNDRIQENPVYPFSSEPTSQHMGSYYYTDFQQQQQQKLPNQSFPLEASDRNIPRTFLNPNSQDWVPNLAHQNQLSIPPGLMTNPATILQSNDIEQDYQRFNNYNPALPGTDPISSAQHFAHNFDYKNQSNVPPGIYTYKGLPSQKVPFVGQSSSFHQFMDVAPNTYSNAPYIEGSSHSFNPAQSYVTGPTKSYLASPNNFQRGFPDVQTDPALQKEFQSNQNRPSNPFNQYDDWNLRTEQNPTERSESQFHPGVLDNQRLINQTGIVSNYFDRSEEIKYLC
jgi:hypothetical protein